PESSGKQAPQHDSEAAPQKQSPDDGASARIRVAVQEAIAAAREEPQRTTVAQAMADGGVSAEAQSAAESTEAETSAGESDAGASEGAAAAPSGWGAGHTAGIILGLGGVAVALDNSGGGGHTQAPADPPDPTDPEPPAIEGRVVKGYLAGAAVFIDKDGDGLPDPGHPAVYTDAEGRFTLPGDYTGPIVAIGGVDTLTNTPLGSMIFSAPEGATVVAPLTTLIRELMESGLSADEAESILRGSLGLTLPDGESLLHYDPIANIDSTAGARVEDVGEMVLSTLLSMQSILVGAGVPAARAAQAPLAALAEAIAAGSVDLTDASVIELLLEESLSANGLGTSQS